jgi:hypothetical protein
MYSFLYQGKIMGHSGTTYSQNMIPLYQDKKLKGMVDVR